MGLLAMILGKRKVSRAEAYSEEIKSRVAPYIDATFSLASLTLHLHITYWDLSNPTLLNYLGYVAGIIDAGDLELGRAGRDDWTATEIVLHEIIEEKLSWIQGVEEYLKISQIGIASGGTMIGELEKVPAFSSAMRWGINDFLDRNKYDHPPIGLYESGLIDFNPIGVNLGKPSEW